MAEVKPLAARRQKKKVTNQTPFGVILFIGIIGAAYFIRNSSPRAALMWLLGVSAGFTLQRSRFCFTASLRDPILTGGTSLTKAVVLAIAVSTVGFAALQYSAVLKNAPIPGNISPAGIHVAIGAVMFGIGMVIAGGCASGTLMRVGEGFLMQMLSLVFFILGSLWGTHDFEWWNKIFMPREGIFLPQVIGWLPALFVQFGILLAIFIFVDRFGKRNIEKTK